MGTIALFYRKEMNPLLEQEKGENISPHKLFAKGGNEANHTKLEDDSG